MVAAALVVAVVEIDCTENTLTLVVVVVSFVVVMDDWVRWDHRSRSVERMYAMRHSQPSPFHRQTD